MSDFDWIVSGIDYVRAGGDTESADEMAAQYWGLRAVIAELDAARDRLERIIRDAPHEAYCEVSECIVCGIFLFEHMPETWETFGKGPWHEFEGEGCTCWKAAALEAAKGAEG